MKYLKSPLLHKIQPSTENTNTSPLSFSDGSGLKMSGREGLLPDLKVGFRMDRVRIHFFFAINAAAAALCLYVLHNSKIFPNLNFPLF